MPARQCILTGQLPRTCECETYGAQLPPGATTFARRFARYGYDTVAAGKLHLRGPDKSQGWTHRIGRHPSDTVERAEDASDSRSLSAVKWSDAKEVRWAGIGDPNVGWKSDLDEYRVRGATSYLEDRFLSPYYDRQDTDRPLFLMVSLTQPHYPYLTTAERFGYYLNRVDPSTMRRRSTTRF